MKDASWTDCLNSNNSKKITPDREKAKSLIEISEERIKYSVREINEKTANFVFEDYYSSVLELVQAIVLIAGYNVTNHICLGFFIRDIMKKDDLFRLFDDCRYKRNSLVYYGKRMDFETAKDAIEKAKRLIKELNKLVNLKN